MCCLQAVAFAKKYVLQKGPIVLEMDTYRYHGHSMSDPGSTYRTRDEISSMRQLRDPVEHVRKLLLEKAGADPAELKKIEKVKQQQNCCEVDCEYGIVNSMCTPAVTAMTAKVLAE